VKQFLGVVVKDEEMLGLPMDDSDLDTRVIFCGSLYKAKENMEEWAKDINACPSMIKLNQKCKVICVKELTDINNQ
tara:strand:- start:10267 stop:10494 length:228 start_codon:yes stop_codon:yes gene_type:complete